jgi:hypothetical protein
MENPTIERKLNYFYESNQIPNIIFHGSPGTGKTTIVQRFIGRIYANDKLKIKTNVMYVNCSQGKGIKFIRDEVKFFAKSNLQSGVKFKTIVLHNADSLTNDAQSALRRCIELFSFNTRFFIVVENKHKLLNPIVSRFCEIYVPERVENGRVVNLHQHGSLPRQNHWIRELLADADKMSHKELADICLQIYEQGSSCLDIIDVIQISPDFTDLRKSDIVLRFHIIKAEFRCEKMLMMYLLDYVFFRAGNLRFPAPLPFSLEKTLEKTSEKTLENSLHMKKGGVVGEP